MTKISFAEFQERALYGPGGYFSNNTVGKDFKTSPTLGTVFARVLGNALDEWWSDLGEPARFDVIEGGGGDGTLAKAILELDLRCKNAIKYTIIERSAAALDALRESVLSYATSLPYDPVAGVILANEMLDNMPVSLFEFDGDQWREVCVKDTDGTETFREAMPMMVERLEDLVPSAIAGTRVPLQTEARGWIADAHEALSEGRIVCFDYARTTSEMAALEQHEWLRTYRGQQPGVHPLQDPGLQDITCDVALDQLPTAHTSTQAEFLERFGIDDIRAEAQRVWEANAADGGMTAMKARSELSEIDALTDPNGLGGFTVFEWPVG